MDSEMNYADIANASVLSEEDANYLATKWWPVADFKLRGTYCLVWSRVAQVGPRDIML
jgi:hypothetical protein